MILIVAAVAAGGLGTGWCLKVSSAAALAAQKIVAERAAIAHQHTAAE